MVEKVKPMARLAAMNTTQARVSSQRLPRIGTAKISRAAATITAIWTYPTAT